jgi:hypothetical protein
MNQEITQSAANYILELNNAITQFNILAGNYCNVFVTAQFFHNFNSKDKVQTQDVIKQIDENERQTMLTTVQQARFYAIQTFLRITALKDQIKQFQTDYDKLKDHYNELINNPFPTYDQVQIYAIELNKMFATVAAQDLLTRSVEYYDEISNANANE